MSPFPKIGPLLQKAYDIEKLLLNQILLQAMF